jgi:hypothetical protein
MEWISVKDRLPKKNIKVIVRLKCRVDKDSKIIISSMMSNNKTYIYDKDKTLDDGFEDENYSWVVTHWMPLPEPPKNQKRRCDNG